MSRHYRSRDIFLSFVIGTIFGIGIWYSRVFLFGIDHQLLNGFTPKDTSAIVIPMEPFPEPAWRTPSTLDVKVVASTPFARFEIHKVKTESGAIVNDWLWTDERSHVNILVHLKEENKFLMFYQKKYGLEKPYYAVVGGLFNKGETGLECAHRELLEETGLEAESLIDLGRYRVQVNRGGGILYAYYAKNCVKSTKTSIHAAKAIKLLSPDNLGNLVSSSIPYLLIFLTEPIPNPNLT